MKYLPQDMFETFALHLAWCKTSDDSLYEEAKYKIYYDHKDLYPGDLLWLEQAEAVVPLLVKMVRDMGAKDKSRSLRVAMELRQRLDENLNPPSFMKKIFGGTSFTKSHPDPYRRKELALRNIAVLYVRMVASGFQHR